MTDRAGEAADVEVIVTRGPAEWADRDRLVQLFAEAGAHERAALIGRWFDEVIWTSPQVQAQAAAIAPGAAERRVLRAELRQAVIAQLADGLDDPPEWLAGRQGTG